MQPCAEPQLQLPDLARPPCEADLSVARSATTELSPQTLSKTQQIIALRHSPAADPRNLGNTCRSPSKYEMEQRFDIDHARPTCKRPAAAADNLGGESKRLRVWPIAEPLHHGLDYGNTIGQAGALVEPLSDSTPDAAVNCWAEVTLSDEMTVLAHQPMSGLDDSLSTPETHAVFTPSATLIPELASPACTPETGYSVSSLVKEEEVVVDNATGPSPLPRCRNVPAVEGDQGESPTEITHDVCFGVVGSNGRGPKR